MDWDAAIKKRYVVLTPLLDERSRRLLVAAESQVIGRSGTAVVSKVTGVSRRVIRQGMAELKDPAVLEAGRVRRPGGGRRAYLDPDNKLRASLLADPAGARKNTKDNTPSVVNVELVKGDKVDVTVAAKGGGSEAKSKFVMLNPSDSVVEWVLRS